MKCGDILLSKTRDASEIQIGDDVVYKGEKGDFVDKIVTHRVIDIQKTGSGYTLTTKGIANYEEDPKITDKQILGVVISKIGFLSTISKMINNLYAFYFIIFLPLVLLVFIEVRRTILDAKKEKAKKNKT